MYVEPEEIFRNFILDYRIFRQDKNGKIVDLSAMHL
jgi:hypothetical protein